MNDKSFGAEKLSQGVVSDHNIIADSMKSSHVLKEKIFDKDGCGIRYWISENSVEAHGRKYSAGNNFSNG